MKRLLLLTLLTFSASSWSYGQNLWEVFAKTKFESRFNEELQEYLFYPNFSPELKQLEGTHVTLRGYFVPFAPEKGEYVILSKFPMSQCFFCGGGGPESIAEVFIQEKPSNFKVDELITVRGELRLNTSDFDHLNFVIRKASILKRE